MTLAASALGLVSAMPSGPGPISEQAIAVIAATAPPGVSTFLLTCLQNGPALVAQARRCGVDTLQLVDEVQHSALALLRAELPYLRLVQVIHVTGQQALEQAAAVAPFGVDLCSGVRTDGRLDERKLAAFMELVVRVTPA